MRWVLACVLCMGCSVIYDTDDLEICSELPTFTEPVCSRAVLSCLSGCGADDTCQTFCYDENMDGEFDDAEVDCYQCVLFGLYQCIADAGCAREVELTFCCQEALCGRAGCPASDNPCQTEGEALNQCTSMLDPGTCGSAGLECFR